MEDITYTKEDIFDILCFLDSYKAIELNTNYDEIIKLMKNYEE